MVALAARVAGSVPLVGQVERERFKAVLLDEFQDTSEAQRTLLRSLFHDPSVALTAVGDPNQSIYGWRGASATTLLRFPAEFAGTDGPADVLPLSTSWRNDELILAAANVTAAPLARPMSSRSGRAPERDRARSRSCRRDGRGGGSAGGSLDCLPLALAERPSDGAERRRAVPATILVPARHGGPPGCRTPRRGGRSGRPAHHAGSQRPRRAAVGRAGPDPGGPAHAAAHRARRAAGCSGSRRLVETWARGCTRPWRVGHPP